MLRLCEGAHIAGHAPVSATKGLRPGGGIETHGPPGRNVVLILSTDAVGAALLGALVETLGYLVLFLQSREAADDAFRRERPSVAMVDCNDPTLIDDELLGRARMRGITVIMFGTADALNGVRQIAADHKIDTILMPVSADALSRSLRKAIQEAC